MRNTITPLFLSLCCLAHSQPFNWQWSVSASGAELEPAPLDMAVDAWGNTYVTGLFWGLTQWGSLPPVNSVGEYDVYVAKYGPDGTALWVAQGGGSATESANGIAVDGAGNAYITGYTTSPTADFGSTTLSLQGTMDIVVAKLNSDGQWQWAKRFGSNYTGDEKGEDIVATPDGEPYITGAFKYYLEFDEIADLEGCSTIQDLFLLHLDTDGEPVWAHKPDCTNDDSYGVSTGQELVLDGLGNLFLGARYRGDTRFFETDTLINQQSSGQAHDCMLAKYTLDGVYQWVRWIGGYGYDDVKSLATDAAGHCYVAMRRESEYDLPEFEIPSSGSMGTYRAVLLKTSPSGEFLWWQRLGNSTYDHGISGIAVNAQNDILVGGWFEDRFEFDEVVLDGSGPFYGSFLARFDTDNNVEETFITRDGAPRRFMCLGLDGVGDLFLAGGFSDTLSFPGIPVLDVEDRAMFLAGSGDMNTALSASPAVHGNLVVPSPCDGQGTVRAGTPITAWRIWNASGELIDHQVFAPACARDFSVRAPGIYAISATSVDGAVHSAKFVVVR